MVGPGGVTVRLNVTAWLRNAACTVTAPRAVDAVTVTEAEPVLSVTAADELRKATPPVIEKFTVAPAMGLLLESVTFTMSGFVKATDCGAAWLSPETL